MQKFIILLTVVLAATARAAEPGCETGLDDLLVPNPKLARVEADLFTAADTSLLRPGLVLTHEGRAEVLAVDAVFASLEGANFAKRLLDDAKSSGGEAWVAEVTARLAAFAELGRDLPDWDRIGEVDAFLAGVREIFFTRVVRLGERRMMLISLRAPSTAPATPPPLPRGLPPDSPRARQAPAGAWASLAPIDFRPRYVFWEVEGVAPPLNVSARAVHCESITTRMFERTLLPLADAKRRATGADRIFVPFYSLQYLQTGQDPGALLYEARFEERSGHQAIRIVAQHEATPADLLIHAADFVRHRLEPSKRLGFLRDTLEIRVPAAWWDLELDASVPEDAIERSLKSALESDPNLVTKLRALPNGARFAYVSTPEQIVAARGHRRAVPGFAMVFSKDDAGRIFVLSWIRSPAI